MSAMIENISTESFPLPYPFRGVLAPGERTVVNATAATVLAALATSGSLGHDSTLKVTDVATPSSFDTFRVGGLLTGGLPTGSMPASQVALTDAAAIITATETESAIQELSKRLLAAVADATALAAITATQRADGSLCMKLDDMTIWQFDAGSAAGASDWVVVPAAGTGRWVRTDISLTDLAGVTATTGGEIVGLYDPNSIITATTLGGAAREIAAEVDVIRPGTPMFNRVIMLGAPGAIVAGDTVTIGGDVYEFNAATPPAGGTAGYIWVYQGASSADSRANFINAVNNVTDAANITYDGAVTESMYAVAGTTLGTVNIFSAESIGSSTIVPSATATACSETLTTATDVWDDTAMYGGVAQGATQSQMTSITLTANQITAGFLEVYFDFTPTAAMVTNRNRRQAEAWTITGDAVVLTLAGGGAPNNQAGDVLDILAQG